MSSPLAPGSVVWGYIRVSSDAQRDKGLPVEGQRDALVKYCTENGLRLTRIYTDEAVSGTTDHRPQFQEMVAEASRLKPTAIVMWSWSRFSRDQNDALFYKANLRRNSVDIITIEDEIPRVEGFESILESLIHWKDEQYVKQLADSTKRGQHRMAEMGYCPSGAIAPIGYRIEHIDIAINGKDRSAPKMVIDEDNEDRVKGAWEMRLQGATFAEINEKYSLYRYDESLSIMFRNTVYKGVGHWKESKYSVPAYVTADEWQRVQDSLPSQRGGAYPRYKSSPYLLSSLVYCGYCGCRMSGRSLPSCRGISLKYYWCRTRYHNKDNFMQFSTRVENIETAVITEIMDRVLTEDIVAAARDKADHINQNLELNQKNKLASITRRLERNNQAINNIRKAIEAGDNITTMLDWLREREAEKNGLLAEYAETKAPIKRIMAIDVEATRRRLSDYLNDGDILRAKEIIKSLIDRITITRETITIDYRDDFYLQ